MAYLSMLCCRTHFAHTKIYVSKLSLFITKQCHFYEFTFTFCLARYWWKSRSSITMLYVLQCTLIVAYTAQGKVLAHIMMFTDVANAFGHKGKLFNTLPTIPNPERLCHPHKTSVNITKNIPHIFK